ncbi:2-amino-4-hydroxy-6-hydroxymethyldihydropteridinediphosphokinase [soil metagenome]
MATPIYLIALGSNRPGRHGAPKAELRAALREIGGLIAVSRIVDTAPLGPSLRRFANAVAAIESSETPPALLARLKSIERDFGRRPGRRWGARVMDLDIILWSDGVWADRSVTVPHPEFRTRGFVVGPAAEIAPLWRDPVTNRSLRQIVARLTRSRPLPNRVADGRGP